MAAQDPNKGGMVNHTVKSGTCGCSGSSNSVAAVQSKDLHPSKNDDTPKVRKPYTITKQREKWTEEEHQKFLEALKLYGRGWRQIEEHVGTKTAVQIRSHAQKFFSKVVRESNGHSESSVNPIEIPPPRPKRKPVHPYPRKSIDSWRGTSISNQYERSPSPNLLVENQSPTSVLSTFASDSPRSDVSGQLNGCASATSCTSEMHSVSLPSVDKENEYVTSNSSLEEEKRFNLGPKLSLHMQGEASATTSCTSIMLFGKTVLVTDSNQPSPLAVENVKPLPETCQERLEIRNEKLIHAFHSKQLDAHLSIRMDTSKWKSLPSGAHVFSCMESNRENSNSSEGPPNAPLHWLALYQGSPVVHLKSCYQSSMHRSRDSCLDERLKEKESLNNRSCTGSIAGSLTEVENRESLDVDLQCTQAHHEEKCNPHNGDKGFVSYKRCFAEREMISSVIVSEEQERQRARVCS